MSHRLAWAATLALGIIIGAGTTLAVTARSTNAAQPQAHPSRYFDLRTGDIVEMAALDLGCSYFGPGDRFGDRTHSFHCSREGTGASIGVDITADWLRVFAYSTPRRGTKTLLYQHRRNP